MRLIIAHVRMHNPPTWIDTCTKAVEVELVLVAHYTRPNFVAKGCPTQAQGPTQTLKVQKMSLIEMAE